VNFTGIHNRQAVAEAAGMGLEDDVMDARLHDVSFGTKS
jgi:hypothetical protein